MIRAYFFGCWNEAGHFLWSRGGYSAESSRDFPRAERALDGTLAPRRMGRDRRRGPERLQPGALCWMGQGRTPEERQGIDHDSAEYPQGQYLVHQLPNGFTAMAWWDRCQGDTRGGCSSTVLLEGTHDAAAMLEALAQHFPHVLTNLERHGVQLVEVPR